MPNNMDNGELDFDQLGMINGGVDFMTPEQKAKFAGLSQENQRAIFDFINQERAQQVALAASRDGEQNDISSGSMGRPR